MAIIQNGCIYKHGLKTSSKNGTEFSCISLYLFGSNTCITLSAFKIQVAENLLPYQIFTFALSLYRSEVKNIADTTIKNKRLTMKKNYI